MARVSKKNTTVAQSQVAAPQYAPTQYAPAQPITPTAPPVIKKRRGIPWIRVVVALLFALIILVGLFKGGEAIYKALFLHTASSAQIDEKAILKELENIMVLPEGATQFALIASPDLLKEKSVVFEKAEKGDIVIAFLDENVLVIYRPSSGKIVNMSTIADQ